MDELDKLRAALKAAPPPSDPNFKAVVLTRAIENFDTEAKRAQETKVAPRPKSDRQKTAGFLTGARDMIARLTPTIGLATTASVAAILIGLAVLPPTFLPEPAQKTAEPASKADNSAVTSVAKSGTDDLSAAINEADGQAVGSSAENKMREEPFRTEAAPLASPETAPEPAQSVATLQDMSKSKNTPAAEIVAGADGAATLAAVENTETYSSADANAIKSVADAPVSTFSIDVDTASYSVIRSSLNSGTLPPIDAVRIEEMVNYFPYAYPAPKLGEVPFNASVSLFTTPWNKDTELLRIGLQGALPTADDRPPLNLVLLVDTSGSMDEPNKLPLLKQSFRLMLGKLRSEDRVAIVAYAGSAGVVLEPTAASDQATILEAFERLGAGGSTAGAEGLQLAYQVAESMQKDGRINRVLLATDGDFNVGIDDPAQLIDFIAQKRAGGTYLSVLGFGRGNLDDATMQALAQNGNGEAAYIDTLAEAQKVLVDQFGGALFPIADDVKIQIEFNPAAIAEYRLIGYETRALAREDFNNDKVDAGEIGAGLQVTALYEVTPVGSPAQLSDPLRYGAAAPKSDASELGFLKIRYKSPGGHTSSMVETAISGTAVAPDADARFAAAIAGFGQLLGGGKYLGRWSWDDAIALANGAKGEDSYGYRAEAVQLMRLAESLSRP